MTPAPDRHRPPRQAADGPPATDPPAAAPPAAGGLAGLLAAIVPPGGRLGHREHLHLAFAAVQRHGPAAAGVMDGWLRQLAAHHGEPQKFHVTMTRAWTLLVAHHAAGCPPGTSFAAFLAANPALLDKRLLARHYSAALLGAAAAREQWVDPDLAPFPWHDDPGGRNEPEALREPPSPRTSRPARAGG